MSKEYILEGKNTEEIISNFLKENNLTRDKIEYTVLNEGSQGLFGLMGSKKTQIKITIKSNDNELVTDILKNILDKIGISYDLEIEESEEGIKILISSPDSSLLIGKRGQTLNAIQYLLNTIINMKYNGNKKIIIDIENYRQKREESLKKLADNLGRKVIETGRPVKLEPMIPSDRKQIHLYLTDIKGVTTRSIGKGLGRRIMVVPDVEENDRSLNTR